MNAEQHVPPFRFKGFSDFWEQRKLSDLAMFNPRLELPDSFQYVDLESVSGTELINHRTETKSSAPSRAQRLAKKGDIFYQTVRPYQKNNYLYEKSDDDYVFSTGYAQLRPYEDGYFLFSRLQENGFVSTVLDHSTGTSYPAINSNDLAKLEIMVPLNLNEQQAIGKLFRHIDNAIALHQHKLAKLKELKKGYLQKLFPQNGETVPEFRFKGYSDAWEKRKFVQMLNNSDGLRRGPFGSALKKAFFVKESSFVVYEQQNAIYDRFNTRYRISEKKFAELHNFEVLPGDFLLSGAGTIGRIARVPKGIEQGVFNQALIRLRINESMTDSEFFLQFIRSDFMQKNLTETNPGSAIQNLVPMSELKNWTIITPVVNEQRKIGSLLKKIDSLIAATQCKLDLLKKLKKGYLQKMFC